MGDKPRELSERIAERFAVAREWLRRVMPRVALAAVALYILRLFIRDTWPYRETPLGLVGTLTVLAVCVTVAYYALKLAVRVKRKLLWRVRRRLIITYLFIGLTPIILLLILGALAATGGSTQTMVRVVTVELNDSQRRALEGARALAEGLASQPADASDRALQAWLDDRSALLRATLPGARVSVWRGAGDDEARLGEVAAAQLTSAKVDDSTRGVGADEGDAKEALPAWLEGRDEWNGFVYLPPPKDSSSAFGTPSLRALVRRSSQGRAVAVLVTVPVSRALVNRLHESTGVGVHPYFIGVSPIGEDGGARVEYDFGDARAEQNKKPAAAESSESEGTQRVFDFRRDQFGDEIPEISAFNFPYPVILDATDWTTGRESPRPAFVVDWSWAEGGKQFWSDAALGATWWTVLYFTAVTFLVLELLALFSAGWMTRAVTGTVHKLYRATAFIKRGDFSHRIRTRSRDQLGELAVAFNDMSADIETLLKERVERERLEREIEIAAEVQAQLFPRSVPVLKTAQLSGECRAARGVAGDYYDFVEAAPDLVAVALGDVSGKGISASLVMSNLQAALRAQVSIIAERLRLAERGAATIQTGKHASVAAVADGGLPEVPHVSLSEADVDGRGGVARMTENINEQLCRATDANRFATLFLALYDDRTRTLTYTNAGHNAPALVRAGGKIERLSTGGTILGAFDSVRFDEGRVTLREGDLLVLFSDGLTEALDAADEEYGESRLVAFAAARRNETVNNIRRSIFDEVDKWSGASERGDDQTLVILKAQSGA
jgi:sigma-B regulation protein RsbU (phosphoserine phosphatase)